MKIKAFCFVAFCLVLVAGCGSLGGSSRGRTGSLKPLLGPLSADSQSDSFTKAVQNDPFPRAQAGQMQVAVRR